MKVILLLLAGCYASAPGLGKCPDIGLQCSGPYGHEYCQHPAGAVYQTGACPDDGCDPVELDGAEYETACVRNAADTGDVCAVMCAVDL